MCLQLQNSDILRSLDLKLELLPQDQKKTREMIEEFSPLLPDSPAVTNAVVMDISLEDDAKPAKQPTYRMNPQIGDILRSEIDYMLENKMIELSNSDWSYPCLPVPKPKSSYRIYGR